MPQNASAPSPSVKGLKTRSGSWHLRRMVNGRLINKAIGRIDVMPLSEAERIAIDLIGGKSLAQAKAPSQTMSDVLDDLLASPKGLDFKDGYKNLLERLRKGRLKRFMSKTPAEIDRHEIRTWYNKGSNTPAGTDTAFRTLHRLFEYAIALELVDANPCDLVNRTGRFKKRKRTGSISTEGIDLGQFVWSLIAHQPKQSKKNYETARDVIVLLMATGLRKQEAMNLKWDDVDLRQKAFTIKDTKNRRNHTVPLTELLKAMLKTRKANISKLNKNLTGDAALTYVFPNRNGTGPITDVRKTLGAICEFAEIERIMVHDLRRTFATLVEELDIGVLSQARMLNHASSVTADYTQISISRLREQYEKVSARLSLSLPVEINGIFYEKPVGSETNLLNLLYGDTDKVHFEPPKRSTHRAS